MDNKITIMPIKPFTTKDVAFFLNAEHYGTDFEIKTVTSIDSLTQNSIVFSRNKLRDDILNKANQVCFITNELPTNLGTHAFIVTENPRLAFAKVLNEFFLEKKAPGIGVNTIIHPTARIHPTVIIGNNCIIDRNVIIGEYTEIRNNVVIGENVRIGKHCLIRSNVVIGEEGFGFEYDKNGIPIRIPHLGGVEIGDNVEIGNFTAIARGTITDTVIKNNVKIDNLVHIAHNCIIEENSLIVACSEISGGSMVGKSCWLGVGAVTMQKIKIGDNALIGIGSVILKDVPPNAVVAGNPAKVIRYRT